MVLQLPGCNATPTKVRRNKLCNPACNRSGCMNKSAAIREVLAKKPGLSPKEIQAELSANGVEVSRSLCKVVRHRALGTKKARRSDERKLRRNEAIVERQVTRMSKADYAIWDRMKSHVALLSDKDREYELHSQQGSSMQRIPEIKKWLDAVSTWRARRRRQNIFRQFIYDLKTQYPKPDTTKRTIELDDDEPVTHNYFPVIPKKWNFEGGGLPKHVAERKARLRPK